jgi:hypothetical protein
MFFAETQNKLLYAVTNQTAAELIVSRANENEPNMALKSWKGSIVRKQDIFIAKNYLYEDEIDTLNRLVVIFLETAELRAKEKSDLTINFWKENIDKLLEFNNKKILTDKGSISNSQMEVKVRETYYSFDKKRKSFEVRNADLQDLNELNEITNKLKNKKADML